MHSASVEATDQAAIAAELDHLARVADWMDTRFRLPGTKMRFGLDGLLGLMPGVGDSVAALPGLYMVARARGMGAPTHVQATMVGNIALDLLVGAVPVVGDLFDFGFKANSRNVSLLRKHYGLSHQGPIPAAAQRAGQRPKG